MSGASLHIPEAFIPLWTGSAPGLPTIEHYAFHGGRGGGKSHNIATPIIAHSCQREERVVCGREFQNSIKDSVKELLEKKIFDMGMSVYFKVLDTELVNTVTKSRFSFIGMNRNPASAKSLEGCTMFWAEEANMLSLTSVEIIVPTIRATGSRLIWSWNNRYRDDPVDEMFLGANPPEASYVRQISWRDNPWFQQTRMPSEFRRSKRAKPKRHEHIWEGAYDENPDVAIFDDWEIGKVPVGPKDRPRFGMDFGFGSDPNVLIKLYVLEHLNIIYIAEEAIKYKLPNNRLADFMDGVSEARHYRITADSARPETIDYLQSEGFSIYGARKGQGSVKNGITFLQGYKLVVSPDCPITLAEIKGYKWDEDASGKPLPFPAKNQQDHCIDSIRYAVEEDDTYANSDSDIGVDYV